MKKIIISFLLTMSLISIAACTDDKSTVATSSTSSEMIAQQVTIKIQEDGKEISSKTITFKEGDTVYEALKQNFSIEDQDGFITTIDGKAQDQAANKYWMYTINGKEASKGAKEIQLKAHDTIIFNLAKV